MKNKYILLFAFWALAYTLPAQLKTGIFENSYDIGNPKIKGQSSYDPQTQAYSLSGGGYNIWFERDEFQYLYNKIDGDFILTANFSFVGEGKDPHRKVGWMIRESTEANAAHVSATLHGDGLTLLQWRELKGAFMRDPEDQVFSPKRAYSILQLERKGSTFIMRAAHDGEPLQWIGSHKMKNLGGQVLAGLFISSHNPDVKEEATVWNVRIDKPLPDDDNGPLVGCRLETINVFDGKRKVIFESEEGFEAPNWMPDGKRLLFNKGGSIFTIPLTGGEPTKLNTGIANRNNNDHGISFDGKTLAISHHREGLREGGSTVYVLPLGGGEPVLVTEGTPSYWHGWAPNNKEVVYVAKRNDGESFNIYRANIQTKKETQLTFNKGSHVDGPEYSPDGIYIYYNGNQSGTMQLWRMKPDGTGKEQLTFDQYNNWFPHISPDGKWIAFISFPDTIDVDAHPRYKRVELKLMPVAGGAPKVIAYLYGGQGTINVPSWSPDSKQISFMSNSGK
ncbi:MAG: hypothetical protein OEY56_09805 [Cyclobacteriaceae bacterium]|nr:hypothetical protein [Cyclobacteriaceae bacterium]